MRQNLGVVVAGTVGLALVAGGCDGNTFASFLGREAQFKAVDGTVPEGAGTVDVEIQLDLASKSDITVPLVITGTAIKGQDFTAPAGTLVVPAGETSAKLALEIVDDSLLEDAETIVVTLATADRVRLGTLAVFTLTIVDNDAQPTLSVADAIAAETDATLTFDVTLAAASGVPVRVAYQTVAGLAEAGLDFEPTSGLLTFDPGVTLQSVAVQLTDDALPEGSETFALVLASPVNATLTRDTGTGTILDDETFPDIEVLDTAAAEQAGSMVFTVRLSEATARTVSVRCTTADDTATAGSDYSASQDTVSLAPGTLTQTFSVPLLNDTLLERSESLFVDLDNALDANILRARASGTILDDEVTPTLSINDPMAPESDPAITFTVTVSEPTGRTLTVNYATANNTAVGGADYTATNGTLTIPAGAPSGNIEIPLIDDTLDLGSVTFFVDLSGAAGAAIAKSRGVGTILDDERIPVVSVANAQGSELAPSIAVPLSLSEATGLSVTVRVSTSDLTATAGSDYAALANLLVTFAPGQVAQAVNVGIFDDLDPEPNETFRVTLSSSINASLGTTTATITILDDETVPTIRVLDTQAVESTLFMSFAVTLSVASGAPVTTQYSTRSGSADLSDYAPTAGTVTFAPGETLQTIPVTLIDDLDDEGSETVLVDLSNNSANSIIGRASATGTILDDETIPVISLSNASTAEDVTPASFLVTLSEATGLNVTADYTAINGSAEALLDFDPAAGSLDFAPGETQQTILVGIIDDNDPEGTEDFSVDLANLANADPGALSGIGTIFDDDTTPDLTINDVSVPEDGGSVTFTVSLSAQTGTPVTLSWATANGAGPGGATAGSDYSADNGNLTFGPGVVSLPITVTILDNGLPEASEAFVVNLSNVQGAVPVDSQGLATITDNDAMPSVEIDPSSPTSANENDIVATPVAVRLSGASGATVTVPYSVVNDTAEPGDYGLSPASPLVFSPGVTSLNIEVTPQQDADSADELFTITLGPPTNATLGTNDAHGVTLVDDESVPLLLSAETLDANLDGRIDHFRLTFSKPMSDQSFPGYTTLSNTGNAQSQWLVQGRTDVVLVRGAAAPGGGDLTDDEIIYIRFTPSPAPDTGAKPDVTTTASPGLVATDSTALAPVTSGTVVEIDMAAPLLLRASTESGLSVLNLFFSELVGPSTGCPGTIQATDLVYDNASGGDVSAVQNGSDTTACDDGRLVLTTLAGTFTAADVFTDRIRPVANRIYDAAANAAPATFVTLSAIIHPFVLTASSVDLTLARIEFSEPMQSGPATTLANYQISRNLADPDCTAAPSLSGVSQVTSEIYQLTTSGQLQNCEYTITVLGDLRDIDENASLVDPKSATFLGRQPLKIVSARALSLRTFVITLSKSVLAGGGAGGAGNLSYYTIAAALGSVVSAVRYDSVTGNAADADKIMVTHSLDQGGAFYSVIVSTQLLAATGSENLLPDPSDRTTFQGLGGSVTRLDEGALFIDPFGDGSTFSFTFSFAGKVHAGPNDSNSAVFRFDPDGQNPVTVTFNIATSEPSNETSFSSQTYSNGVDAFVAARVNGEDYLIFGAHKGSGQFTDLYFTQDTDNVLDIRACNIQPVTIGNTLSLQTILGHATRLYFAFGSDSSSGKPLLAHLNLLPSGVCGTLGDDVRSPATGNQDVAHYLPRLGGSGTPNPNGAGNIGIDSVIAFDPGTGTRLYAANNGGIISTPNLPLAGGAGGSVWTQEIWDGGGWAGTTQQIPNIGKLRPGEKGVPQITAWGGALFVARNRSDNNRAEIWKFTPPATWTRVVNTASTVNGMNANNTEAAMITVNGSRLYLGFDNDTNGAEVWRTKDGITATTFAGHNDLEKVAPSGFGPIGATDLAKNKYIMSNTSVFFGGRSYLYLTVGCNSSFTDNGPCDRNPAVGLTDFAIRMFRQVD